CHDRKLVKTVHMANRAHRVIDLHFWEHDVHQDEINVSSLLQRFDASFAGLGGDDIDFVTLQQTGHREDVPNIVVHDQYFFAGQNCVRVVHTPQEIALV